MSGPWSGPRKMEANDKNKTGDASIPRFLLSGALIVAVLVGGIGGWAALASISGAVIAPAMVVVESHRKNVQHLQGGIVGKIRVRDGDVVKSGDLLIRLDDTLVRANLGIVTSQLDELLARQARLEAERDGIDRLLFPEALTDRQSETDIARSIAGQTRLWSARREALAGQRAQLREKIGQLRQEIVGLAAQRDAKIEEIALIKDELNGLKALATRGLVPKTRLVALQRQAAQLTGDRGRFIAEIARAESSIGETEIQIIQLERDRRTEVVSELRDVQTKISELSERKIAAEDQLRRIDIRAPIGGYVHQLGFHTIGGVIPPGETILQIVPAKDILLIEARLDPADIDQVYVGQAATVRFPGFNQRTTPELVGRLQHISADIAKDARAEVEFYKVRVTLAEQELARLGQKTLVPGMPAEIFLQTEQRTALSYLVKPLSDQFQKAFREE